MATQETAGDIPEIVRILGLKATSNTPEFFKRLDVCDQRFCSRCSGQVIEEWELRTQGLTLNPCSIEEATETTASLVGRILHAKELIRESAAPAIALLRNLDQAALTWMLEEHFHLDGQGRLAGVVDEFSWSNTHPDQRKLEHSISYFRYTIESFLFKPELLEDLIIRCADRHPAELVGDIEADIEPLWAGILLKMKGARCFVDLRAQSFGKIIEALDKGGMHVKGICTYMKAAVVLKQQHLLYGGVANFVTGLIRDNIEGRTLSESVSLPRASPPMELHTAIEAALESFVPAFSALEDTVSSTITSASTLKSDHDDRAKWASYGMSDLPSRAPKKACALYDVTWGRLIHLGILHALEHDIKKCLTTAKARATSPKKVSNTALFKDWAGLQQSVITFLEYCGQLLLYSAVFKAGIDRFNAKSYHVTEAEDGRRVVDPEHQLAFSAYSLLDGSVTAKRRIQNFLAFLAVRRTEQRAIHWELDWVKDALVATYRLIEAMEILHPFSVHDYDIMSPRNQPETDSEAVKFKHFELYRHAQEIQAFFKNTWKAMELRKHGRVEENHAAIWDFVFGQVEPVWRKNGIGEMIIGRVKQLRKRGTTLQAPARPNQSASIARTPMPAQLQVANQVIVSYHRQGDKTASKQKRGPRSYGTFIGQLAPSSGRQPTATAAPRQSQTASITDLQSSFEQHDLQDKPARPSMFTEELSWEEQQLRRDAKMATAYHDADDTAAPASEAAPVPEDDGPTPQIEFHDEKTYYEWRSIFPLPGANGAERGSGSMKWEELIVLMESPPLGFTSDEANSRTFNRTARQGWAGGAVTVHKPHGKNSTLEKRSLDLIRKDLRRTFGWTAEDFVLV